MGGRRFTMFDGERTFAPEEEKQKGREQADQDIKAGALKFYCQWSLGVIDTAYIASEIALARYGVEITPEPAFSCVLVGKYLRMFSWSLGYNSRVHEELIARFGRDVWKEACEAAREQEARASQAIFAELLAVERTRR